MLSSVSLAYKESANCRLEANYVHKHTGNLTVYQEVYELWNVPHRSGCLHLQGRVPHRLLAFKLIYRACRTNAT